MTRSRGLAEFRPFRAARRVEASKELKSIIGGTVREGMITANWTPLPKPIEASDFWKEAGWATEFDCIVKQFGIAQQTTDNRQQTTVAC